MRFFNTEGPARPDDHYAIAPLDRVDVDELLALIRTKRYVTSYCTRRARPARPPPSSRSVTS